MRLVTPYAPGSFLKPCLIVSTLAVSKCMETALRFVEALNCDHAFARGFSDKKDDHLKTSEWVKIKQHGSREEAVQFHLDLVMPFKNGGDQEEWDEGWKPYLELYERWCPDELKERR